MFAKPIQLILSIAFNGVPLLAMAAAAPPASPPMAQPPGSDLILQYYPAEAKAAGTGGSAVIRCGRTENGGFENCQAVSETPQNAGFSAAALAIAQHAAPGCVTLTAQQRSPQDVKFAFAASPLSIEPNIVRPGWMIQSPAWTKRPSAENIIQTYPRGAKGVGTAKIVCKVSDKGGLIDCAVREESPTGQGFGAAAIQLSRAFAMKTKTCDGSPTAGSVVMLPLRWDIR